MIKNVMFDISDQLRGKGPGGRLLLTLPPMCGLKMSGKWRKGRTPIWVCFSNSMPVWVHLHLRDILNASLIFLICIHGTCFYST